MKKRQIQDNWLKCKNNKAKKIMSCSRQRVVVPMPPVIWLFTSVFVLQSDVSIGMLVSFCLTKLESGKKSVEKISHWYHKTVEMILIIKCDDNSQIKNTLSYIGKKVNRKNLCLTLVIECFSCLLIWGCLRVFCRMVMVCFLLLISSSWKK